MKLIRVQSAADDLTGFFSNEFNEPITLEPNSQIALINGTFALNALNLDLQTATIKFKTKSTNDFRTAIIPAAKYTQHSLLEVLNKVMNNAVHYNGLANDTQFVWHASVHNHLLSLNFARSSRRGFEFPASNLKNIADDGAGTFTAAGSANGFKAFAYSDTTVIPTTTQISCRPTDSADAIDNVTALFGLLKEKPVVTTATLDEEAYKYGLLFESGQVSAVVEGVDLVSTAVTVVSADRGGMILFNGGKVQFYLLKAASLELIHELTIADPIDFEGYPVGISLNAVGAKAAQGFYSPNPVFPLKIEHADVVQTSFEDVVHSTLTAERATKVTLQLDENARVALGYDGVEFSKQLIQGGFRAAYPIAESSTPSSMVITLPNLGGQIQSYDGGSEGKRRPIVAVIPSLIQTRNLLRYQPPYPLFVDLGNGTRQQLSKLDVRVLDDGNEPINLEHPGCCLTFALSHK